MAWRKIKLPLTLEHGPIVIHYNSEYNEYRVRIIGKPEADYFTSDKNDALVTAQFMRNEKARLGGLRENPAPAPKRKTRARTQSAAEAYVRRKSQATGKAPSKRLVNRRIKNLRTPEGVFPNPSKRKQIVVEYELSGPKYAIKKPGKYSWKELAAFPDTKEGAANAIDYAKAYHKIAPNLKIRVNTK